MPGRYMISGPEGNGLKINSQKILQPLNEARAAISPCGASLLPTESRNWRYQPHRVQSSPKRDGNCHGVTQRSRAEKTSQFELADKKQIQPQDTQPWRSAQPIPTVEPADRFAHGCKSTSPDRPIWATLFPEAGCCMILHDPDLAACRFGRRLFLRLGPAAYQTLIWCQVSSSSSYSISIIIPHPICKGMSETAICRGTEYF